MKVFYDFEFIDNGKTIDPISLGMVAEDGRELYLINEEINLWKLSKHPWLMGDVVPHLPLTVFRVSREKPLPDNSLSKQNFEYLEFDDNHPDFEWVYPKSHIANGVSHFLYESQDENGLELWAWYSAYDHVCLSQLFGPMSEMPKHIPMRTNDLAQLVQAETNAGNHIILPNQKGTVHKAIDDARWNKQVYEYLQTKE